MKTTRKELVTGSLRREIGLEEMPVFPTDSLYELSDLGLPRLKKRERIVTIETIYRLIESADNEDFRRQTTNCEP